MSALQQTRRDRFYIGGEWAAPASDRRVPVIGANDGAVIGEVPDGTEADVDRAVAAARKALPGWRATSPAERSAIIARFADAMEKRAEQITASVSAQNGMPIALAQMLESGYVVGLMRYYAHLAGQLQPEERRPSPMGFDTLVRRESIGVVGGIVPWNYPVTLAIFKIGPALATGCTLVLKPSPGTVLDSYWIAEAAAEAGVPAGVINWVPGGLELGAYLVSHPGIDKVAFTGSTGAGRKVAEVCGRLLRPVTLELGGKSAGILLDDVDLAKQMPQMVFPMLGNNGQTCLLSTRVLAPEKRYDEVVEAFANLAKNLKVGHSLDPSTEMGPMASEEHRTRVEAYIAKGKTEARLVAGGGRPKGLDKGWFVEPTIFADVANNATIAREEIFGPVLSIIKYKTEAEAIALANDSEFGLGGTVWSSDAERAARVARQVETGSVGVNGYMLDVNAPFGGVKASGMGRELGPESLNGYLTYKSVYLLDGWAPPSA
jgi:acyl-CoA reductase-like NAD-dependent aldehyde dehydrogenase